MGDRRIWITDLSTAACDVCAGDNFQGASVLEFEDSLEKGGGREGCRRKEHGDNCGAGRLQILKEVKCLHWGTGHAEQKQGSPWPLEEERKANTVN